MTESSSDNPPLDDKNDSRSLPQHRRMSFESEKDGRDVNGEQSGQEHHTNGHTNGNVGGEKAQGGLPSHVGFWHSSLNQTRKNVVLLWARTSMLFKTRY